MLVYDVLIFNDQMISLHFRTVGTLQRQKKEYAPERLTPDQLVLISFHYMVGLRFFFYEHFLVSLF